MHFLQLAVPSFTGALSVIGSGRMSWFKALRRRIYTFSTRSLEKTITKHLIPGMKGAHAVTRCVMERKCSVFYLVEHREFVQWMLLKGNKIKECHQRSLISLNFMDWPFLLGISSSRSGLAKWLSASDSSHAYWASGIGETNVN